MVKIQISSDNHMGKVKTIVLPAKRNSDIRKKTTKNKTKKSKGSAACVGNDCSCKCGDTLYYKQTASGENTGSSIVIVVIVLVVMSVIAGAGYYIYVKRLFFFSNSNDVYYNSLTDNQKNNLRQSLV